MFGLKAINFFPRINNNAFSLYQRRTFIGFTRSQSFQQSVSSRSFVTENNQQAQQRHRRLFNPPMISTSKFVELTLGSELTASDQKFSQILQTLTNNYVSEPGNRFEKAEYYFLRSSLFTENISLSSALLFLKGLGKTRDTLISRHVVAPKLDYYFRMFLNRLPNDHLTLYNVMISAVTNLGYTDLADRLFTELSNHPTVKPNWKSFEAIFDAHAKHSQFNRMLDKFDMLEKSYPEISMDPRLLFYHFEALTGLNRYDDTNKLIEKIDLQVEQQQFVMDSMIFHAIVASLMLQGRCDLAIQRLAERVQNPYLSTWEKTEDGILAEVKDRLYLIVAPSKQQARSARAQVNDPFSIDIVQKALAHYWEGVKKREEPMKLNRREVLSDLTMFLDNRIHSEMTRHFENESDTQLSGEWKDQVRAMVSKSKWSELEKRISQLRDDQVLTTEKIDTLVVYLSDFGQSRELLNYFRKFRDWRTPMSLHTFEVLLRHGLDTQACWEIFAHAIAKVDVDTREQKLFSSLSQRLSALTQRHESQEKKMQIEDLVDSEGETLGNKSKSGTTRQNSATTSSKHNSITETEATTKPKIIVNKPKPVQIPSVAELMESLPTDPILVPSLIQGLLLSREETNSVIQILKRYQSNGGVLDSRFRSWLLNWLPASHLSDLLPVLETFPKQNVDITPLSTEAIVTLLRRLQEAPISIDEVRRVGVALDLIPPAMSEAVLSLKKLSLGPRQYRLVMSYVSLLSIVATQSPKAVGSKDEAAVLIGECWKNILTYPQPTHVYPKEYLHPDLFYTFGLRLGRLQNQQSLIALISVTEAMLNRTSFRLGSVIRRLLRLGKDLLLDRDTPETSELSKYTEHDFPPESVPLILQVLADFKSKLDVK